MDAPKLNFFRCHTTTGSTPGHSWTLGIHWQSSQTLSNTYGYCRALGNHRRCSRTRGILTYCLRYDNYFLNLQSNIAVSIAISISFTRSSSGIAYKCLANEEQYWSNSVNKESSLFTHLLLFLVCDVGFLKLDAIMSFWMPHFVIKVTVNNLPVD